MEERMKEHLDGFERRREDNEKYREKIITEIAAIKTSLQKQDDVLATIKTTSEDTKKQATKTNGSVADLKLWQATMKGAIAVLTILVVPILIYLIQHHP